MPGAAKVHADEEADRLSSSASQGPPCRASAEALERVKVGLILTDGSARLRFVNRAAEAQLTGPHFFVVDGRLQAAACGSTDRLHRAIRDVTTSAAAREHILEIVARQEEPARLIIVAPLPLRFEEGPEQVLAMVIVPAEGVQLLNPSRADQFELTRAEIRLLQALVNGRRIGTYAAEAGIALSTAKTHLSSLFDKTGERRQADLIRRALSDSRLRQLL